MKDVKGSEEASKIVCLLKSCANQKDLRKGSKLHTYIREHQPLESNSLIASTLVSMYARCGALAKAQEAFDKLPVRNVITWTVLIAGYVQKGQGEDALKCFDSMLCDGHTPDAVTFTCALKACGIIGAAVKGQHIHDKLVSLGLLEKDIALGNTLVDMYARCGALVKAKQVLEGLPIRDVVSWNALIGGYVQHGHGEEALKCFDNMQCEGHTPDIVTFTSALKACRNIGALLKGEIIHDKLVSLGMLKKDLVLGNALMDMYARCGVLEKVKQVFKELPVRDVVTWTTLIAGYAQWGQGEKALKCFDRMQCEGHSPTIVTFVWVLKACGSIGLAVKGERIHDMIASLGMLDKSAVLGTNLVDMYVKCGALAKAQQVLEELHIRDVITWNAVIVGYAQRGQSKEVLKCFDSMQREGHCPDAVTFMCALKACTSIGAISRGQKIHDDIASLGMLEKDVLLGSTLVDMYVRCGLLHKAQQVLKELPVRDVVTWTALIAGYVQQGQGEEALICFDNMLHEGHSPDAVCITFALKACGSIGAVTKGEIIHDKIANSDILLKNITVGNTLVDMYAKCGALRKAQQVLEGLPVQDVVTWNALTSGYAQHGQGEEALKCFDRMQQKGHPPNLITYTCALKACGSIAAVAKGEEIHDKLVNLGMLEKDSVLGNSLVDMYAKCAALDKAGKVLGDLSVQDVSAWSALIGGYALLGQSGEAINCFQRMQFKKVKPDSATLICMLTTFSHSGLLDQAEMFFTRMGKKYGIMPNVEHYHCMVDLFARAGKVSKALAMIEKMPSTAYFPVWRTLLGACHKWGDQNIGKLAFDWSLHLDKCDAAAYLCMTKIYRAAGSKKM